MSTVRRSLASLLVDELDLLGGAEAGSASMPTFFSIGRAAEQRLTAWMLGHLTVSTVEHSAPHLVKATVIGSLGPPLNDKHAHHGPYWVRMSQHRANFMVRIAND